MTSRLVVIGGDAAGMSAASQARRRRGPDDLAITTFELGPFTSYSACGIPFWVGGVVQDRDKLIARTPQEHRERDIEVHLGHTATAIDTDAGRVQVRDSTGTTRWEGYDDLLIATGAMPQLPDWADLSLRGVHLAQTLSDGQRLRDDLASRPVRHAVMIGGGYVGVEMVEALLEHDLDVTLLQRAPVVMPTFDHDLTSLVTARMEAAGVGCRFATTAQGLVTRDGTISGVATTDGVVPADLVVLGIGVTPRVDLARSAGIAVGQAGGIVTDDRQATATDGVWAAGDCTQAIHRVSQQPVAIALGTTANKQGRVAGINLGGGDATYPGTLGTMITRFIDIGLAKTGLTATEAIAAGFEVEDTTIDSTTIAGYLPDAEPMTIRLTTQRSTGRVLGGQIVGGVSGAKRIDTVATAIWAGLTAGELLNVDLAYAPPFSSVWDPVAVAARSAWREAMT